MKKFLCFVLVLSAIFFTGCDNSKKMTVKSATYDDSLKISIKADKIDSGGNHYTFKTDYTLVQIKEIIDNITLEVGTITSTIYNNDYLIIEKVIPIGKINYYMIADLKRNESKPWYYFSSMSTFINETTNILIPYHYIMTDSDAASQGLYFNIDENKSYEVVGCKEDIFNFYTKVNIFEITSDDNSILINVKDNGDIYGAHTTSSFTITFKNENDKLYAVYKTV